MCFHLPVCPHVPRGAPPRTHSSLSHESTTTHDMSSTSRLLLLLPLHHQQPPSWPSLHLRDRWVSDGAGGLVPSDQLPLISCPSSSPPPSISTHMALPQKAVNHAPIAVWGLKISPAMLEDVSCCPAKITKRHTNSQLWFSQAPREIHRVLDVSLARWLFFYWVLTGTKSLFLWNFSAIKDVVKQTQYNFLMAHIFLIIPGVPRI